MGKANKHVPHSDQDSIIITFIQNIEPLTIKTDESLHQLTYEDALKKALEYIQDKVCPEGAKHSAPMFAPVFGLVSCPEKNVWLPHWHIFERISEKNRHYQLRVRHRPPADVFIKDTIMCEYLFLQLLEEFLNGHLRIDEENQDALFRLLGVALFLPTNLPMNGSVKVDKSYKPPRLNMFNIRSKLHKEIKSCILKYFLFDDFLASKNFKKKFEYYKTLDHELVEFKTRFYEEAMKAVPQYCFEIYEANIMVYNREVGVTEKKKVSAYLSLYSESKCKPGLYYGKFIQCFVEEIQEMVLLPTLNLRTEEWTVRITWKNGPPKMLIFPSECEALSFISMVQGYLRLFHCYNLSLNSSFLKTATFQTSQSLRSFGPLSNETAKEQLENSTQPCFLIHQSPSEFDHYVVKVAMGQEEPERNFGEVSDDLLFKELDIKCLDGGRFELIDGDDHQEIGDCNALHEHLKSEYRKQILPNKDVVADITEYFRPEIPSYGSKTAPVCEAAESSIAGIHLIGEVMKMENFRDKNPFVMKFSVWLRKEDQTQSERLVMMQAKLKDNNEVIKSFNKGFVKMHRLSMLKPNSFLKFYGIFLDADTPSGLVEYAPYDLLTYLSEPKRIAIKVDFCNQIINILEIMEQNKLFHGNIRCRKFMVFNDDELHIKLGDSGVTTYLDTQPLEDAYNDERLPWLSPERRQKLTEITYESEVYAVGTTFCEILYRDDDFRQELRLPANESLSQYLSKNKTLPKPPVMTSENTDETAITPDMKEVLEGIWAVIERCWCDDPAERPFIVDLRNSFQEISKKAGNLKLETQGEVIKKLFYDAGGAGLQKNTSLTTEDIRNFLNKKRHYMLHPDCVPPDYKRKALGQGYYGVVYKGTINVPTLAEGQKYEEMVVAIKELKSNELACENLIKEAKVAVDMDHENIVKVLYFCYDPKIPYPNINTLIMEYMNSGSLLKFTKQDPAPDKRMLLKLCSDVVEGMVYLSCKQVVHRDLAARNVLLTTSPSKPSELIAKVADFGLARHFEGHYAHYKMAAHGVPFFWMPPECLSFEQGKQVLFTTHVDVWSFGVMLWETFSHGKHPRKYYKESPVLVADQLQNGWRLPQLPGMDSSIYIVMKLCWQLHPKDRPFFADLKSKLRDINI